MQERITDRFLLETQTKKTLRRLLNSAGLRPKSTSPKRDLIVALLWDPDLSTGWILGELNAEELSMVASRLGFDSDLTATQLKRRIRQLIHRRHDIDVVAYCSFCLRKGTHALQQKNVLRRNVYTCLTCNRRTLKCRYCDCMAQGGRYWDDECCGEHNGSVPSFEKLSIRIKNLGEYRRVYESTKPNLAKAGIIGGVAVGTGALIAPVAFLAAPAVGGTVGAAGGLFGAAATNSGLATLGLGSLAAGGFGIAGGVAVVTAAGAALGAGAGAVVAKSYLGEVKDFKLTRMRIGNRPTVIFVNGFLSQGTSSFDEWQDGLYKGFPRAEWYQLHWEAKRLRNIGGLVGAGVSSQVLRKSLMKAAARASKQAAKKLNPLSYALTVFELLKNPWHTAMVRAQMAGSILADTLARLENPRVVLFGNSLGARLVAYALLSLGTRKKPCIESVHLLGGAVGAHPRADWLLAARAVKGKIYNYYSKNDDVLRYMYKVGTFFTSEPIGRTPIRNVPGIENVNVTRHVDGHSEYKPNLKEFLRV